MLKNTFYSHFFVDKVPKLNVKSSLFYSFSFKYFAVCDFLSLIKSSGVPAKTTSPPCFPASGPMSMM